MAVLGTSETGDKRMGVVQKNEEESCLRSR